MIETKLINLNSNNAIKNNSTYLSNVFFNFPTLIVNNSDIKNVKISILNAQFPYSFYIINVYNNVLRMSVNAGAQFSITLTPGNYNSNTLITEILAQLTTAGVTTISIVLSSITGRLSFTTIGTSIEFFSTGSTILTVLGFDKLTNYASVTKVLTAPYPLNLLNTLKIRICSYALCSNSLDSSVNGNLNLLASFAVNAESYGLNLYENQTNIKTPLNIRELNGFDIQILDDNSNLINFNNVYWTITMLLEIEYNDIIEMINTNPNYPLPTQQFWGVNPNQPPQPLVDINQLPQQGYWGVNPNDLIQQAPEIPEIIDVPTEGLPIIEEPEREEPFIQAETPDVQITDPTSLEQLLQSNGIYQ